MFLRQYMILYIRKKNTKNIFLKVLRNEFVIKVSSSYINFKMIYSLIPKSGLKYLKNQLEEKTIVIALYLM